MQLRQNWFCEHSIEQTGVRRFFRGCRNYRYIINRKFYHSINFHYQRRKLYYKSKEFLIIIMYQLQQKSGQTYFHVFQVSCLFTRLKSKNLSHHPLLLRKYLLSCEKWANLRQEIVPVKTGDGEEGSCKHKLPLHGYGNTRIQVNIR